MINKKYKFILIIIFTFFSFTQISFASTEVYLKNNKDIIKKGDVFNVDLKISSDKNINAIDGIILFDKNILEVKSVKIDNSKLSLWVKEPVFDNKIGEISFVGGSQDGFSGLDNQILEVTFLSLKSGESMIGFKDIFSVFLNDGLGTRVNPWLRPLTISVTDHKNDYTFILNYLWLFILIFILFIIILIIKFKNKKNAK